MIQEYVITAVQESKRFTLVERTLIDKIFSEDTLNKGEVFMNEYSIEQGRKIGAKYMLLGTVASAKADPSTQNGKTIYVGDILFSLRLVDVETGETKEAVTLKPKSDFPSCSIPPIRIPGQKDTAIVNQVQDIFSASTPGEAFAKVLKNVDKQVRKNFISKIPVSYEIIEVHKKDSNGNPEEILLLAGTEMGIEENERLTVIEVTQKDVKGKIYFYEDIICKLTVSEVKGSDFSLCDVERRNASILKTKMEANAKLKVVPQE